MLILNLIVAVCLVGTAKRKRSRSESFTKVMIFLYSVLKVPTLCLDSSKVEHAAVNRGVVGSSPTRGAENRDRIMVLSEIVLQ